MRILVAIDGSDCSQAALDAVCTRPWPAGSEVCVVSAAAPPPYLDEPFGLGSAAYGRVFEAERKRAVRDAARAAKVIRRRAPALPVVARSEPGSAPAVILDEARRWRADLILLGSHGRGVAARFLLGSVSNTVALHAPCSVEIVRAAPARPKASARRAGKG